MRELSMAEIDAITGGYGKQAAIQNYQMASPQSVPTPSLPVMPAPLRSTNPQQPNPPRISSGDDIQLPQPFSPKVQQMRPDIFDVPKPKAEKKIYNISFTTRVGRFISKDVNQKEYDMLVAELHRFDIQYTATVL